MRCPRSTRHDSSCPFSPSRGTVRAFGSSTLRLRRSVSPPFGCGVPHEPCLRRACRVGGGARRGAPPPPLKLHVRFSRMQLSRRRGVWPRVHGRNQRDQAHQPQLTPETPGREGSPPRTAPSLVVV